MEARWDRLEAGLLHRCLLDTAVMASCVASLGDYRWSLPGHEWIWKFASSTFEATGEPPSPAILRAAATQVPNPGTEEHPLHVVIEAVLATEPEQRPVALRRLIMQRHQKRTVMDAVSTVADRLARGQDGAAMAALEQAASAAATTEKAPRVQPLIPRVIARIPKTERIPTGLAGLDYYIGGIGRGEMGLIMGLTGVGKSALFTSIGFGGIRYGVKVLHVDTENGDAIVKARYLSRFTGIPHGQISEDRMSAAQKQDLAAWLERNYERLESQLCTLHLGMYESTFADFEAALIRSIADGFKPDLVLFDSPDDLILGRDPNTRWQDFGKLYRQLPACARRYGFGLWVTNQGDEKAKGLLGAKHGRDSQEKAKKASVILSINRPEAERDGGDGNDQRRTLFGSKGRSKRSQFHVELETEFARMIVRAPFEPEPEQAEQAPVYDRFRL